MKFYLRTHGCRANQYDSEVVRAMLLSSGALEASGPEDAEVAIFNSCSVTAAAEAELRKEIRRAARVNSSLRTIVMGCAPGLASRDESISPLRTLPTVSDLIAGADLPGIAAAVGLSREAASRTRGAQTGARGLLRIQDGCDEHCTFCMTTTARGASRSRPARELIDEATALAAAHPEIVLTGIHIGAYGVDTGNSLSSLVEKLISSVPQVRFRLSSLEATEVDDRLREMFADRERLAPYLHAPLQSGSDRVLRRMGRTWYTAATYESSIERIVSGKGAFGLGADIICGFPGETEEDHRQTVMLVERLPFTSLHVFPYSPRPGTAATRLGRSVGSENVRQRAEELHEITRRKSQLYNSLRAGTSADIVVIKAGEGLTEDYLSVAVPDLQFRRGHRFQAILAWQSGQLRATSTQALSA